MAVDAEKDLSPGTDVPSEQNSSSSATASTEPPVVTLKTWIVSCVSVPSIPSSFNFNILLDPLVRLWSLLLASPSHVGHWHFDLGRHGRSEWIHLVCAGMYFASMNMYFVIDILQAWTISITCAFLIL